MYFPTRASNYGEFPQGYMGVPGLLTLSKIISKIRRKFFSTGLDRRFLLVNYHKVCSALIWKIFEPMAIRIGWNIKNIKGIADSLPNNVDVVQLMHGIIGLDFPINEYRTVRFVRDPRDVIVSGFLYHRRCTEEWCNIEPSGYSDLSYPKVPWPLQHLSENEKRDWVDYQGGRSYQQNLLQLNQKDGLIFEMNGYARITINSMLEWEDDSDTLTVRLEDFSRDFEGTLASMFKWIGLEGDVSKREIEFAKAHDISRMSDEQIMADSHISSADITKWGKYFDDDIERTYRGLFGDAHKILGYE